MNTERKNNGCWRNTDRIILIRPTLDVDAVKWLQAKALCWFPGSCAGFLVLRMLFIVNYFLSGVPVPSYT